MHLVKRQVKDQLRSVARSASDTSEDKQPSRGLLARLSGVRRTATREGGSRRPTVPVRLDEDAGWWVQAAVDRLRVTISQYVGGLAAPDRHIR